MRPQLTLAILAISGLAIAVAPSARAADDSSAGMPKIIHAADNPWSKEKEELGKMLFFDPRLSGSNWISCATCHNPALGWSDGLPRAIGHGQKELGRHTPTIINSAFFTSQFWDGRSKTLEEQALGPIQAAGEMNQNLDRLVKELRAIPGYVERFRQAFGEEGVTAANIGKAIGLFEKSIVSAGDSPFDRHARGEKDAMSAAAIRGQDLFAGKARCSICHNGPVFSDSNFYNIGVKQHGPLKSDLGRYNVTKNPADKGAFKTPGLRDVAKHAPYMHDGSEATLEAVVEFYNRGGDAAANRTPLITPLGLNAEEKKDLVEFLKALSGGLPAITLPELPR